MISISTTLRAIQYPLLKTSEPQKISQSLFLKPSNRPCRRKIVVMNGSWFMLSTMKARTSFFLIAHNTIRKNLEGRYRNRRTTYQKWFFRALLSHFAIHSLPFVLMSSTTLTPSQSLPIISYTQTSVRHMMDAVIAIAPPPISAPHL